MNQGVGLLSPPFGMILFVMKGVSPPDISMEDIYQGRYSFCVANFVGYGYNCRIAAGCALAPKQNGNVDGFIAPNRYSQ